MAKQAITLTDNAAEHIRHLLAQREEPVLGLRVGVRNRGCSGMSYDIQYATEKKPFDEVVQDKGVTVVIDAAAVMFLIGSEMDYVEDKFTTGFVFNNPNEKDRCGCGESFRV